MGASFADIDNDGDQDLFVTTVRGGNALFENDGHGHFKDITTQAGVALAAHSSGAVFFDYDGDGLVDLLVCNVGRYTTDENGARRRATWAWRTRSSATCIRIDSNTRCCTRISGATDSRM